MTETILTTAVLFGLIPAEIARRKGLSFWMWWIGGSLMLIVALPLALLARNEHERECPSCRKSIDRRAIVCAYCQRDVGPELARRP